MSKLQATARLQQQIAMTPQLLQSIRLLQLSTLELEQELRTALEQNVMLEAAESDEDAAELEQDDSDRDATELPDDDEVSGCDAAASSKVEADFDWSSRESWSGGEPHGDEDGESWQSRLPMPVETDARVAALKQLELIVRSQREALIAAAIVDAVDDNGYLEQPLDGIAMQSRIEPPPTHAEMERVLELVQSVEPTGFAARDLRECLQLQLDVLPRGTPGRLLASRLVADQLDAVAARDYLKLATALEVDAVDLDLALELLLSLNPKPAAVIAAAADAALPDVIVSGARGMWKVELNTERLPRVRVNGRYERMLGGTAHAALRDQLQEARWLVRGLEMRHDTLLRATRAIFERQQAFLERGEEGMVSLTLREIADSIGMHESTICRITHNKWVQTPWGVYELKAFFPSQISGAGTGADTSGTAVKAMIRRIIDGEKAQAPLCDGDIAALLARKGVQVARRTVAKYREAMRIPAVKDRTAAHRPQRGLALHKRAG